MKVLSIILIVVGGIGIVLAGTMFGDIGLAASIGAITAILSGVGFLLVGKKLIILSQMKENRKPVEALAELQFCRGFL